MTELELILDLHKDNVRQGPGSDQETLKALEFIQIPDNKHLKIADIGCGTGRQTLILAKHTNSHIKAIDLFPEFLEVLNGHAGNMGFSNQIEPIEASMESLPFKQNEFDILWSEGAIYNMGFEKGIKAWKEYLKPGGFLAVSEITWISNSPPKELEEFWKQEYPEIDTASNKIKILESHGYTLTGYFYLKPESWIHNYHEPLESNFEAFLKRHDYSDLAKKVVEENLVEIELYKKYKDHFSYGFYIARKDF